MQFFLMTDAQLLGRTTHFAIDEAVEGWVALGPVLAGLGLCLSLLDTWPDERLELAASC